MVLCAGGGLLCGAFFAAIPGVVPVTIQCLLSALSRGKKSHSSDHPSQTIFACMFWRTKRTVPSHLLF